MRHYYAYVYVRIMQALGAYGFRGFYERKAHFLQSVPYALKNLRWLLAARRTADCRCRTLMAAFTKHDRLGEIAKPAPRGRNAERKSRGANFQFFISPGPAQGRDRAWRGIRV